MASETLAPHDSDNIQQDPPSYSTPAPPSYADTAPLSPEEVLELARRDLDVCKQVDKSVFFVARDLRRNPEAKVLQEKLLSKWQYPPYQYRLGESPAPMEWSEYIVEAFFSAIAQGLMTAVEQFIQSDLVDANTPRQGPEPGLTPLLCAVQHRQHDIIAMLISHGADVNGFGMCRSTSLDHRRANAAERYSFWMEDPAVRTPIQLAAQLGDLETVKLLHEQYLADVSLVAPDGQIALRLASRNKHADVVAYLPATRGGGYRRWKTKHQKFMKKMRYSVDVLTEVVTFTFYKVPKWIVKGMGEGAMYIWRNKHKFPGWCRTVLKEFWELILRTPQNLRDFGIEAWKFAVDMITRRIPKALAISWRFLMATGKRIGRAVIWIFNRTASLIHTVAYAILSAFRALTWANIRAGFNDLMRAIFVTLPKALYLSLISLINTIGKVSLALFRTLSKVIWWTFYLMFKLVEFLLSHVWKIFAAIGGTMVEAGKEVHVWFNPKA